MESNEHSNPPYPEESGYQAQERLLGTTHDGALPDPDPVPSSSSHPYTPPQPGPMPGEDRPIDPHPQKPYDTASINDSFTEQVSSRRLSKAWQQRLYWIVPLGIIALVLIILFEVYKTDFERWVSPLTDWLRKREDWSWVIPVSILFILSFPPLFGHEIVQLIVGLTYPLGVAIGIACAGSILGEAGCFIAFKYGFTGWVDKKIKNEISWASVSRVAKQAGFKGVLVIRYSIVPPHLANPLFACTGMKFWLYMTTVILSLPKSMIFIALGSPTSDNTHAKAVKWAKVIAVGVLIAITVFASFWIRKKMAIATREITAERALGNEEQELDMLRENDTSYRGVVKERN